MKKIKKELLLAYHLILLLHLAALHIVALLVPGLAHEIMGLVLIALIIGHVILCYKGYASMFKALSQKPTARQILKVITLISVAILLILQIISAILISEHIFNNAMTPATHLMHAWSARINAILIIIFIALSLKELAEFFSNKTLNDENDNNKE